MVPLRQILVAIDGSDFSATVLGRAIDVAKRHGATLFILHVIETPFLESPYSGAINEEHIRQTMTGLIDKLNRSAGVEYHFFVTYGSVATIIDREQKKPNADLLIIGAHSKTDSSGNYIGTTALKLLRQTEVPVLMLKSASDQEYRHLLVPTNLSEHSRQSVLFARKLFPDTTLAYVHAYNTISDSQAEIYHIAEEEAKEMQQQHKYDAIKSLQGFIEKTVSGSSTVLAYNASVSENILELIGKTEADLLVLDPKGVDHPDYFEFGSTTTQLLYKSPIDVLLHIPPSNQGG